jgi:hypothetical protein
MWSQFATAWAGAALLLGCSGSGAGTGRAVSAPSLPTESPDLALSDVAFVRLSEGRIAARGTARELLYRRSGGRLDARTAWTTLHPDPDTGSAMFGEIQMSSPTVEGEIGGRRGTAAGGVTFRAVRGDEGRTERILWDGAADLLTGDRPVDARGPGYTVRSQGFTARADGSNVTLNGGVAGTLQASPQREPAEKSASASRQPRTGR